MKKNDLLRSLKRTNRVILRSLSFAISGAFRALAFLGAFLVLGIIIVFQWLTIDKDSSEPITEEELRDDGDF